MKKQLLFICLLLIFLSHAAQAQDVPGEGFITTKDGVKLFYKIVGSGAETLVVVHGGPGNSLESIRGDLEPLAKNRRVIYYDQRGNGRSDLIKDGDKLAVEKHVADLEAVREHFKLDKMTLLGNSWGGLLIGFYAAAHPDRVERLIFHSPASPTKDLWSEMNSEVKRRMDGQNDEQKKRFAAVNNLQSWTEGPNPRAVCNEFYQLVLAVYAFKAESMKLYKGDLCAGPEEAVRRQMIVNGQVWRSLANGWNLLSSLGAVKAPVLVIHGTADVIPVKSSEAWAGAMPNARLLLIEKSGHMPQFEQPEIFFKAVETFLNGEFPADAKKMEKFKETK